MGSTGRASPLFCQCGDCSIHFVLTKRNPSDQSALLPRGGTVCKGLHKLTGVSGLTGKAFRARLEDCSTGRVSPSFFRNITLMEGLHRKFLLHAQEVGRKLR